MMKPNYPKRLSQRVTAIMLAALLTNMLPGAVLSAMAGPADSSTAQSNGISFSGQNSTDVQHIAFELFNENPLPDETNITAFTQLDLYPNIETMGVVVTGANLPKTAELLYRQGSEAAWRTGHPLMRIDDGRLVGSLFGLSPATSYSVKVLDGSTEISGSMTTQPDELQFTPSAILHVNDDAPPGGDGSAAAPLQTIQEGVNRAGPGTQILVADGIYREAVSFSASGSAGNWIQIKAEGNGAILDGSENLTGNIWTAHETKSRIWFTKIGGPIDYLARDQKRFYAYDDLSGLFEGRGHNNVPMNEGWFFDRTTARLYLRSLDDPSTHTWQLPRLSHAFDAAGRDWLWIEGFEIRFFGGGDGCGVCMLNASHVVIRRNKIHNLQKGIFIDWNGGEDRGNDARIEYNEIFDPPVNEWPWNAVKGSSMEGTGIIIRGHIGAIVRNNNIHQFFNGIYTGSSGALENSALAFDADIYNNHIHQISDDALEPEGACINQRFRNNIIDSSFVGISLAPVTRGPTWVLRSSFAGYTGRGIKWDGNSDGIVLIYHNTFWTAAQDANSMDMISAIHNAVLRNNIFQNNGYAVYEVPTGSTGNDWNYDNWYTTRSPRFKWENINYNTIAELCAAKGLECNGHENPPGLTNPVGGDFTLLPSSPNIDRGVVIHGINDGFAGSAPDLGAYESALDSPPSVSSSVRADPNPSSAASLNFTVTFSESVTGVDVLAPFSDFALAVSPGITGASIANITPVSGTTYTVNVLTGSGNGTIRLDIVDDDSIRDAAGNPLGGVGAGNGSYNSGESYTVDKSLPAVTGIVRADPTPTTADTVHFTVTFSEEVTGVDAGDFTPAITGGISGPTVTGISGSGKSYTITVNTGTGDGTLRLDLVDNDSILNANSIPLGGAGAGNGNYKAGEMYTINRNIPIVINSMRMDPDPTSEGSVRFSVTFSEAVSGVDVSDFTLTVSGVNGAGITGVSGADNIYTVSASTGTGDGTIRLDVIDDDSVLDAGGNPLGGAGAGNGSFTGCETYTINKSVVTPITEIFTSDRANDGWVLESKENSSRGGSRDAAGLTFNLGDDPKNRQYRSILHFSTSSLPDNAVIAMAILMTKGQGLVGTDPFTTHGNILVDIRSGTFGSLGPFGISSLQVSDFQNPASRDSVGMIQNNPVSGWYWSLLDSTAFPHINLRGPTQFRLRFQLDDDNDLTKDYLKFYSGNFSVQSDRPQLLVEYYIPR